MLLRQEPFQTVDCSPTTLALIRFWAHNNCCNGSAGRFLTIPCVVPILLPATISSVPHRFLAKQHFPSDDDVQTDAYLRLTPLSGGKSLRHRCTEIGLTDRWNISETGSEPSFSYLKSTLIEPHSTQEPTNSAALEVKGDRRLQTTITRFISGHTRTLSYVQGQNVFPMCLKCNTHQSTADHLLSCMELEKRNLFESPAMDRRVCGTKGDPNHYATVCPVTKPFPFTKPSAEHLSTWCENIVQDKKSLARLVNIMKILHERRHDIIMD
ncbi:hypothetical protein AVEN_183481-1 [Araneus ventricosus]|uniref:Uncharacterized protein n=1 Tax=Araneus ventricosus TaxID=182803 RepID=A0A4Y1ZJZ6_ARAVE|nr:hypothetical protein AVEN_183481-1 [Araneus ventricosus]